MTEENNTELYDRWLKFMLETHGDFKEDPRNKFVFDEMLKFSSSIADDSIIIDIGAGQSELSMFFENSNYVAIDLGIGDDDWDFSQLDVKGDVQSLPIRNSVADAALNLWVMEHVPAPQLMVNEMYRILKPGGKTFLIVPFTLHEHQQPYDFYRYTRYGVRYLFETAGFSNVDVYSDSSAEFAAGHEAHKWLSALSGMLTMKDEQRAHINQALEVTKALMLATAEQFPAKTGGFALNWICSAEKH